MLYFTEKEWLIVGKQKSAGFTTVELLITITVLALVVPGLISLSTAIARLNDKASDLNIINSLAENKVESLRSVGFTGLNDGTISFSSELPATIGSPRSATYTVTSPDSGLKQVDLSITYNDHGSAKTLQYRTYVGELGVGQY